MAMPAAVPEPLRHAPFRGSDAVRMGLLRKPQLKSSPWRRLFTDVYVHEDDWSISSVDESLAAHFEHTVAVTADGPRILTTAGAALLR